MGYENGRTEKKKLRKFTMRQVSIVFQNVQSKARESEKAMSLAFVLLDFQHADVRRRA